MIRPAVIDTNVIVSGLLTPDRDAPTARIVDLMLCGGVVFLLSVELLAEYREVLRRPRIRSRHGLDTKQIDEFLTRIARSGLLRDTARGAQLKGVGIPDANDMHLWRLLATTEDALLVTGDLPLLEVPSATGGVLSPRKFLELLDGQGR